MKLRTMLKYLVGSESAILDIAYRRSWLWIGLLWVLAAGLAREYDGEDLLHEPWHLLLPLGASLISSALLYCLVFLVARRRGMREGTFLGLYRNFLSLYWMMAPMAWLYAIPVERFMSAGDATSANLWLLAIVSLWRVVLMVRVLTIWMNAHPSAALWLVMFFADSLLLAILYFTPVPIFAVMGGIQLTESEQTLQIAGLLGTFLGTLSWPVWAFGVIIILVGDGRRWHLEPAAERAPSQRGLAVWMAAAGSILVWAFILPATQDEQQLRWQAEKHLRDGRIANAIALMSAHEEADFPPHWDPPPRLAYGNVTPQLLDVLETILDSSAAPWVVARYEQKLIGSLERLRFWFGGYSEDSGRVAELERHTAILERWPDRDRVLVKTGQYLIGPANDEILPPPLRERISALEDDYRGMLKASRDEYSTGH